MRQHRHNGDWDRERSRDAVADNLADLNNKLLRSELADDVIATIANGVGDASDIVGRAVRDNPWPAVVMGMGAAWMAREVMREADPEGTEHVVRRARDRVRRGAQEARDRLRRAADEARAKREEVRRGMTEAEAEARSASRKAWEESRAAIKEGADVARQGAEQAYEAIRERPLTSSIGALSAGFLAGYLVARAVGSSGRDTSDYD